MTIGPAPMIRIDEMSVRLGISLCSSKFPRAQLPSGSMTAIGDHQIHLAAVQRTGMTATARRTKKGRAVARPSAGAEGQAPRGRSLDQNDRPGKGDRA